MRLKTLFASTVLASVLALVPLSSANAAFTCENVFTAVKTNTNLRLISPAARLAQRQLSDVREIKVMAYNVENLFMHLGKFERMSDEEFKRVTDAEVKPEHELEGIATAMIDTDPDLIVMEEVEGVEAIQRFADDYLGGRYQAMLTEGNDERGIQIGFLVKRDLPLDVTLETHKDATWVDPDDGKQKRLFSRDAPALVVRRKGAPANSKPVLIFMGVHGKSQRDRGGDKGSVKLRTAQYNEVGTIIDGYRAQYGADVPLMVGGDFNIDVRHSLDVEAIRERMIDPFDVKGIKGLARMTHTFHPRRGNPSYNQLDAVFVSPSLRESIEEVSVYRYKDEDGNVKPMPSTYEERSMNPSDHFPVVVRVRTDKIFPEAHAQAAAPRAAGF